MKRWFITIVLLLVMAVAGCSKTMESPSPEFLDSKLIVRAGVDDLGNVTVKEFVSVLKRIEKPHGGAAELLGWQKTDAGYVLRTKIAAEFDLHFQWSKAEKIALLAEAKLDNGESVPGLQFFMLIAGMPKVKDDKTADSVKPVDGGVKESAVASASPQATNKPTDERRTVTAAKLQGIECNDYCQLKYLDVAGNSQSALCVDAEQCRSWAKEPKSFASLVGTRAELTVVKKFIPEGNIQMDSIVDITVGKTEQSATSAMTSSAPQPTPIKAVANGGSALCKAGESTAFACTTGKKDIALCAVGASQSSAAQLTYRIAPAGQASPEMVYPEQSEAVATAFKQGSQSFTGDKSMVFVSFDKGSFRYVLYSAEGKGLDKAGVAVEQAGKRVANLVCATALMGDWSAVIAAGLPRDTRGFDLP